MAYYTAINSTIKRENLIWSHGEFKVYLDHTRLYLHKGDYELSCIIGGIEGFNKQYKGDYLKWIEVIRNKDIKKAKSIREKVQQAIMDAELIESIWTN